jgi:putative ABC transport system permease protein
MLTSYLKIAWRFIKRNRVNSFINIAGLAIGLASAIFIFLYVQDERGYDQFFKNADKIYQVNIDGRMGGVDFVTGNTPPPVGLALKNAFPEVETFVRIHRPGDVVVRNENSKQSGVYFTESQVCGVDSNFLEVFNYEMLEGNPATCLLQPTSVVITEEMSKKYFGNDNAIGKVLLLENDKKPFKVTGVLKNLPSQSSFTFDMLRPMASYPGVKRFSWSWVWLQVNTYVKLKDNFDNSPTNIKTLETKFPAMVEQQAASAFERIGQPLDELKKNGGRWELKLAPFTSLHLRSGQVGNRMTTLSDIKYVRIFSLVALFIIVLACVNFMNLSTAQSARRSKEVGIRKVLGSVKYQLVRQFFGEAVLYVLLAGLVALMLVIAFIYPFNDLSGKRLTLESLLSAKFILYFIGLLVITTLLAGSYPAFYLTSFKPVSVLKGKLAGTSIGNLFIRNGMVVFQFTISTALIICTIIVFQQLQFTRSADLGLNKENTIVISNSNRLGAKEETFREEITKFPEIEKASIATSLPGKFLFGDSYVPEAGGPDPVIKDITLVSFVVDDEYVPTLQLRMLKGRNFSKDFNDSSSVILNETAARDIGWKDPMGQHILYTGNGNQRFKVIGIVKDFNVQSLHNPIMPFALFHRSSKTYDIGLTYTVARVKPGNLRTTVDKLQAKWKSFVSDAPFDYSFLDEELNAMYKSDVRMGSVFSVFTILSIFVACLGLFGLAMYTAERRIKEIGVRKVLGASVHGLVGLLSRDFIKLVLIAAVIAFPIAWWSMNKWLEAFVYRINIEWWVFLVAAAGAILIALATISYQSVRAAMMNPVKNLRTE